MGADEKGEIEKAINELKSALEGDDLDPEDIKAKTDALMNASMKLGEAMYKAQQESAGAEAPQQEDAPADDGVVDADFEEVDPDKKDK